MAPPTSSVRDTSTPRQAGKARRRHKTPRQNVRQSVKVAAARITRDSLFADNDTVPNFRDQSLDTISDFLMIIMQDIVSGTEEIGNKHTFTYTKLTGSLQCLPQGLRGSCAFAASAARNRVKKIREQRKLQAATA